MNASNPQVINNPIAALNTPVPPSSSGPIPPPKPPKRRSVELNEPVKTPVVENSPSKSETQAPPPPPPKPVSIKRQGDVIPKPGSIDVRPSEVFKPVVISPTAQKQGSSPKNESVQRETPSPNPDNHHDNKSHHEPTRLIPMSMAILRSSVYLERRTSVKMKDGHEDKALLVGTLSKRNREGTFEKCLFTLTKDSVMYQKQLPTTQIAEDTVIQEEECKVIPLVNVLVAPLKEGDYDDVEKQPRTFRFLSKNKSFLLRGKTVDIKEEWFQALQGAALQARIASPSPVSLTEADMAPIWNPNEDKCSICLKAFSFFVRKHHCRNCGICVCELCSKDKVRIPKLDERNLYKVCTHCGKLLKEARSYGFQSDITA